MKNPSTTSVWRKAALAVTSVCVAVLVMEIVFRVAGIRARYYQPHTHELIRDEDGPKLLALGGFVPLATHRTIYYTDPRHYFGTDTAVDHQFNAAGWRDAEHTIVKPPGTYRILGLGDSYLMGQGVHAEDVFFTQLAQRLNDDHLPVHIETLNTGVSGKNTADEARVLEYRGLAYDPDLVVVNFVPNDVESDLSAGKPLVEFYRNYTAITQQPDAMAEYSYLWAWSRQRFLQAVIARQYINDCVTSFDRDSEKWNACRAALTKITEACRQRKVPLMVVVFPFFHELDGDYPFQSVHDRVAEFCRANDVPVLDMREQYSGYSGPELWVHPTDQHPNEIAHRLAADALADFILERRDAFQIGRRPPPKHDPSEEPRLQGLARMAQLGGVLSPTGEFVSFEGVPLTDGDLRLVEPYWEAITELSSISLRDTDISDDSVTMLCRKTNWQGVDLSLTAVTSTAVRRIAGQANLVQLGLENTNVDNAAIASLAEHPALRVLNLAGTNITSKAIEHLNRIPNLETLVIARTAIDENGVRQLAALPNLKTLVILEEQFSASAQQTIEKERSDLTIVRQPSAMNGR